MNEILLKVELSASPALTDLIERLIGALAAKEKPFEPPGGFFDYAKALPEHFEKLRAVGDAIHAANKEMRVPGAANAVMTKVDEAQVLAPLQNGTTPQTDEPSTSAVAVQVGSFPAEVEPLGQLDHAAVVDSLAHDDAEESAELDRSGSSSAGLDVSSLNLQAPAATPPAPVFSGLYSEERKAYARQAYPAGVLLEEMTAHANTLPGAEMTKAQLSNMCSVYLKLKRETPAPGARKTAAAAMARPVTAPEDDPFKDVLRTADRAAKLRKLYPTKLDLDALLAELNKLPGRKIATVLQMKQWADDLNLNRQGKALPKVEPVRADHATIRAWAGERGLCNGAAGKLDMDAVNAKRSQLGLPAFVLEGRA